MHQEARHCGAVIEPRRGGREQRSANQGDTSPFPTKKVPANRRRLIELIRLPRHLRYSIFGRTARCRISGEPGENRPRKGNYYVSNRTHLPRWLRTFRSIGHHRPRNRKEHF